MREIESLENSIFAFRVPQIIHLIFFSCICYQIL